MTPSLISMGTSHSIVMSPTRSTRKGLRKLVSLIGFSPNCSMHVPKPVEMSAAVGADPLRCRRAPRPPSGGLFQPCSDVEVARTVEVREQARLCGTPSQTFDRQFARCGVVHWNEWAQKAELFRRVSGRLARSEEHTSELQS